MISPGISLKNYSIEMAQHLGITHLAVYERQRTLVRLGVLPPEGRGPHRGVRATPNTVAPLLLAGMFADSLSDLDARFVRLLKAKPAEIEAGLEAHAEQQAHVDSAARQWAALGRSFDRPAVPAPAKMVCPVTGASNFKDAVAALLASSALVEQVEALAINRSLGVGIISAKDGRLSQFGMTKNKKPQLEVVAHFPGELVRKIGAELAALMEVEERS